VFCHNGGGGTCAGIVGDTPITTNNVVGNCTGGENINEIANYLATSGITTDNSGYH